EPERALAERGGVPGAAAGCRLARADRRQHAGAEVLPEERDVVDATLVVGGRPADRRAAADRAGRVAVDRAVRLHAVNAHLIGAGVRLHVADAVAHLQLVLVAEAGEQTAGD